MPESRTCDDCGETVYLFKSKRTGKMYRTNSATDYRDFHNCRDEHHGDTSGDGSYQPPEKGKQLRNTGWVVNPQLAKEAWLQDVLNKACVACQSGVLDILKVNPAVRDAFAKLLADAKATASDVAAGEIPF